jgi:flavin-dependent dehydrogenase
MAFDADAAVLGAGVAGAAAAKAVAERGWKTVLIDRGAFPRHKVCGEFLSPEAARTLDGLGLDDAVAALNPGAVVKARLIFGAGEPLDVPLPGTAAGISRYALDAALHRAALDAGAQVRTGTTVTAVVPEAFGYRVTWRSGKTNETLSVRAVIAAWGANPRAGLPGHRRLGAAGNGFVGVKSHFRGIEADGAVELYFFAGGYAGIVPVEGGRCNVAALLDRRAFPAAEPTVPGLIRAAAERSPPLKARLAGAEPVPGSQAAVAPVDLTRKPVAWTLVPHVGDAALMIPPLCGDGMSVALRSAQLCSGLADRYLRGEITLQAWRDEYAGRLLRECRGPLRWGRLLQRLAALPQAERLLPALGRRMPGLAVRLVQATRIREADMRPNAH